MNIPDTIEGLSNEEYHRGEEFREYLSSTQIKDYVISPKYARYKRLHPEQFQIGAEASEKGSLYHDYLESLVNTGSSEGFYKLFAVFDPPVNPRTGSPFGFGTKAYDEAKDFFQMQNEGKRLVSQTDVILVEKMAYELLNNCRSTSKSIREIIKWGKAEISHFVEYEGVKFKYRPDVETAKKIVDWKSVAVDDLHDDTINKVILKFKYHISAAFYQFMEHERSGVWKDFFWVFQQKSAPYDAVLVSAANWAYSQEDGIVKMGSGAHMFAKLLEQHVYCTKNQDFDGAQIFIKPEFKGRRIMEPKVPMYESIKQINFYNHE